MKPKNWCCVLNKDAQMRILTNFKEFQKNGKSHEFLGILKRYRPRILNAQYVDCLLPPIK